MKRLVMPVLSVLVAFAAGCGIGPHVDDFNEAVVAAQQATCACGGDVGYSSEEECRVERPPSAADQACVEALFKNIGGDYEAHLDCRTAAQNRFASCLSSKTCTDLARLGCAGELADDLEDCPAFPDNVQRDLNECLN